MKQTLKHILSAFSGLIIYSALTISTCYFTDNMTLAYLIAGVVFSLLGGLYTSVVLNPNDTRVVPSRKFLISAFTVVSIYSFVSMFTSNALIYNFFDSYLQTESSGQTAGAVILALIVNVFIAPVAEELVFRGCMYRFLSGIGKKFALIFSSAIFAVWHGTIVHLYAAFFGGLIFCCIYEKTKSVKYPILAHMLFNGFTVVIGCFEYPAFVIEPWWVITLNSIFITLLIMLFQTPVEHSSRSADKSTLTPAQLAERRKTAEIVDSVMREHKSRH